MERERWLERGWDGEGGGAVAGGLAVQVSAWGAGEARDTYSGDRTANICGRDGRFL